MFCESSFRSVMGLFGIMEVQLLRSHLTVLMVIMNFSLSFVYGYAFLSHLVLYILSCPVQHMGLL